ncbi:hypothetical protein F5884DRAFT_752154 [Xylogone sp. PMI_703]|nr:hypothetical protein F5884DRAFT_752154 [Xylogone sp. PMI_703]
MELAKKDVEALIDDGEKPDFLECKKEIDEQKETIDNYHREVVAWAQDVRRKATVIWNMQVQMDDLNTELRARNKTITELQKNLVTERNNLIAERAAWAVEKSSLEAQLRNKDERENVIEVEAAKKQTAIIGAKKKTT